MKIEEMPGLTERQAGEIWDKIDKFAGYGFNRSHSVSYTIISYWAMWVKTHHPASFYAAQLSTTKEERLEPLVKDAMTHGIGVLPPDINNSMPSEFNIVGKNLVAPFDRVKGMSEKTARMLVKFRQKSGKVIESRSDLDTMLMGFDNGGKVNKTVRERLDKIGSFNHGKNPGPDHPSRLKDQKDFLPGLMVEVVKIDRTMKHDKFAQAKLMTVLNECRSCDKCDLKGLEHPWPKMGKKPSIMVVTDCPNKGEAAGDAMMKGQGAGYVERALHEAGLHMADFYFTTLVKSPKQGQHLTNEQINACKGYLDREIEILQPPVIIACGSKVIRHLYPSVKGGIDELCGQVTYNKEDDRSVVFGLTPGAIYIEPSRQEKLNEAFAKAAEIIGKVT